MCLNTRNTVGSPCICLKWLELDADSRNQHVVVINKKYWSPDRNTAWCYQMIKSSTVEQVSKCKPSKGFLAIDDDPDPLCRLPHWQDPLHWASLDWVKWKMSCRPTCIKYPPIRSLSLAAGAAERVAPSHGKLTERQKSSIPTMIEQIGSRFSRSGSGSVKHQGD